MSIVAENVVSKTGAGAAAKADSHEAIIGYLLIGTDNTARKQVEADRALLDQRLRHQQFYTRSLISPNRCATRNCTQRSTRC